MINADMRLYDYYTYGASNGYGSPVLSDEVQGELLMAIYNTSTSVIDNIRFKDATHLGLTNAPIDDKYVIQYGEERLKVLYVISKGRLKQVYMKNI